MTLYYQDDYVTLYHGDALELADKWVGADVLITDPPFGMKHAPRGTYTAATGAQSKPRGRKITGDESVELRDKALELWGAGRPAMVFGTWRIPRPVDTLHRLIWWKQGQPPGPARTAFMLQDEEIYILGKGWVASSPPERTVLTTTEHRPTAVRKAGHPTPKPIPLMERLINRAQPEWVIADPFAGSGATLEAARNLGRRSIGVELDEAYCELIATKLSQGTIALEWPIRGVKRDQTVPALSNRQSKI